jgi:AcrR family transcriptional regulator
LLILHTRISSRASIYTFAMPKLKLQPRKAPIQARSQATVAAVLQAAARVLSKESLAGFNTNRVAAVAGVSVGSLYQYFPNKEALLSALIEHAHEEIAKALDALRPTLEGQPLASAVRAVARMAVAQQYGDPVLAAALARDTPLGPSARPHGDQYRGAVARLCRQRLATLARRDLVDQSTRLHRLDPGLG